MSRAATVVRFPMLLVCLLLVGAARPAAAQTVVTTCGQETHGAAALNADLDCTGFDGYALTMHGGTLTMNGHAIIGGIIGVQCDRNCKIFGPGAVTGSDFVGVNGYGVAVTMSQVDISNCGYAGAQIWDGAKISGPAVFSGNGTAITASSAKLAELTITGNGTGVGVGNAADTGRITITGSTVSGNTYDGLAAEHAIKVVNSTIMDNGWSGIDATGGTYCKETKGAATLWGSTVTGNGTSPDCGSTRECADVATCKKAPHLKLGSACGTSHRNGTGIPGDDWGVCTQD